MRVFTNATFLSCEEKNTSFQVLVENRGRIVFTGDTIPEKYAGAEKVDLEGKCVVPAFADHEVGCLNHIGGGSDGPCTLPDPMVSIYNACNHFNPDQRISVDQALKMHTSWAARLSFDEKDLGTLTPGKWANLSVLSQNPLETPIDKLKDITVDSAYVRGKEYQGISRSIAGLLFRSLTSLKKV